METALTFDPNNFREITPFLTSSTVIYILKPMVQYYNFLFDFDICALLILCENKTKSEYFRGKLVQEDV